MKVWVKKTMLGNERRRRWEKINWVRKEQIGVLTLVANEDYMFEYKRAKRSQQKKVC